MTRRPEPCRRIEPDLLAAAIGEAAPAAARRVHEHAGRCAPCRDDLQRYGVIEGTVATLRMEPEPVAAVALARARLETRLLDLRSRLLTYRVFPSPLGDLLIARSELGVALLEYVEGGRGARAALLARTRGLEVAEGGEEVESVYRDLVDYLGGRTRSLDWPLDLRLVRTPFHRTVLDATARIPYGAVVSYKRLAQDVGRPEAVRAVAQALRWNPLPIVVPCHRVVGTSGALTGYAGGATGRKQKLLCCEGVPVVRGRGDYEIARQAMYVLMPGDREYCVPSCPSAETLRAHPPMLFGSRERAEALGLSPCTTCRPDLHPLALSVS